MIVAFFSQACWFKGAWPGPGMALSRYGRMEASEHAEEIDEAAHNMPHENWRREPSQAGAKSREGQRKSWTSWKSWKRQRRKVTVPHCGTFDSYGQARSALMFYNDLLTRGRMFEGLG